MMRQWTISIVIPGEYFDMVDQARKTVEGGRKWVAPGAKEIDVDELTSDLFPGGESEEEDQ